MFAGGVFSFQGGPRSAPASMAAAATAAAAANMSLGSGNSSITFFSVAIERLWRAICGLFTVLAVAASDFLTVLLQAMTDFCSGTGSRRGEAGSYDDGQSESSSCMSGNSDDEGDWSIQRFSITSLPVRGQELVAGLISATIECPICLERIRRRSRTWACDGCYTVLHLRCARACAAHAAREPLARPLRGADGAPLLQGCGLARCPCCRKSMDPQRVTATYHCFCEQTARPRLVAGCVPHSCGLVCNRIAGGDEAKHPHCRHVCTLSCHPGPCPPCIATTCACGRRNYRYACWKQDPLLSCGRVYCRAAAALHAGGRNALDGVTRVLRVIHNNRSDISTHSTSSNVNSVREGHARPLMHALRRRGGPASPAPSNGSN